MTGATWAAAGQAANSNKLEIQRIAAMILDRSGLQSAEWRSTVAGMDRPIEVDLPHKLGREEARGLDVAHLQVGLLRALRRTGATA